jgi:hypothetical protein
MPIPADFPPLRLCEPCKRLFTDYKGESGYQSIQFQMWYQEKGYRYTRTRRDLECSAAFKCVFCKAVASRDAKYGQGSQPMDELCFDEPRLDWYPSLDEELKLTIRYNWVDNVLYIWSRGGIDWTGGDLSWGMYTTAGEFCCWSIPSIVQAVHKAQTTQLPA